MKKIVLLMLVFSCVVIAQNIVTESKGLTTSISQYQEKNLVIVVETGGLKTQILSYQTAHDLVQVMRDFTQGKVLAFAVYKLNQVFWYNGKKYQNKDGKFLINPD